jgi:hypothetical protein
MGSSSGRAFNDAKSAFCFCDLAIWACLCWRDLVISKQPPLNTNHERELNEQQPTEIISEVHPAFRKLPDGFSDNLIL